MPRKRPDLKKRLEELREEPAAPVEVRLQLDASLYNNLKLLASQKRLSLERYLERLLRNHVKDVTE